MTDYITTYARDKIEELRQALTDHITHGRADSYEQYRYMVGRLDGLRDADDILKDIEKRFEQDDDD